MFNLMTKFCIHSILLRIAIFFQWSWGKHLLYFGIAVLVAVVYSLSCVWLFATPLTVARHAPLTFSLQHRILLSPPDTSTTEHHFHFDLAASFFLELLVIALHSSPVAYWIPSHLGGSSPGVVSFYLFILFMGFSWQEYWNGLLFPPPVDHILSELSTMTSISCTALHGMASLSYTSSFTMTRLWFIKGI